MKKIPLITSEESLCGGNNPTLDPIVRHVTIIQVYYSDFQGDERIRAVTMTNYKKNYVCKITKSNIALEEIASTCWKTDEYLLIVNSDTDVASGGIQNKEMKANYVGI